MFLVAPLLLSALPVQESLRLEVDRPLEARLEATDPAVRAPLLDVRRYPAVVIRGRSFRFEVPEAGTYTIDLHSHFFDPYLVLRDEQGEVLAEDDTGRTFTRARLWYDGFEAGRVYRLDACSFSGEPGPFTLTATPGRAPAPNMPRELVRAIAEAEQGERLLAEDPTAKNLSIARLLIKKGLARFLKGESTEARPLFERALAIRESALGSEHPETALAMTHLAHLLDVRGNYGEAWPLLERALGVVTRTLGPEHPANATVLRKLALALYAVGRFDEARSHLERAVGIVEQALGKEHPTTAETIADLVTGYLAQGNYDEALPLCRRVLEISDAALGPDHPTTVIARNTLASVLQTLGRYHDARPMFERALERAEAAFGEGHPRTALFRTNLATLIATQGYWEEVERILEHARELSGESASALNNLAYVLCVRGRHDEARPLYERALAITAAEQGGEQAGMDFALENLARVLERLGDFVEATRVRQQALSVAESSKGPAHADTGRAHERVANGLLRQELFAEALASYTSALEILEATLGEEGAETRDAIRGMARCHAGLGDLERAVPLLERLEAIEERTLDAGDTVRAETHVERALLERAKGDHDEAHRALERARAVYERALGAEDPLTSIVAAAADALRDAERFDAILVPLGNALARERALATDDLATASRLHAAAEELLAQGRLVAAATRCRRALDIRVTGLGERHADTARSRLLLGRIAGAAGDLGTAREMLESAYATLRTTLGEQHPDAAAAAKNLTALRDGAGG